MAVVRPLFLAFVATFALAACAPVDPGTGAPAPDPDPKPPVVDTPPEEDTMVCDAKNTTWAIGQPADQATVDRIRVETHSKGVRVIKPGMAVTMDYREDRVNIDVDAENRIVKVRCG